MLPDRLYFLGHQNHCRSWLKRYDKPRQHSKKQRHYFADKDPSSQSHGFSNSHVWMWELNHKESWAPKNWCFWTVLLEKTVESPLDCKEIQPVNPKEISPEYPLEGLMLKLKLQYFGHWCEELIYWKRPWCWERLKVGGEGDDRGWDSWMASPTQWTWVWANSGSWWWTGKSGVLKFMGLQKVGHDWTTEQPPRDSERQRSLACWSPWGHKDDFRDKNNKINR